MNFLVVDCGTSGCRAAVVSSKGRLLSQSKIPITVIRTCRDTAELDLNHLWAQVRAVIKKEVKKHSPSSFACLGISAMLGWVFLDDQAKPLMPAITYMDNRASGEAKKILELIPLNEIFAKSGRRPSPFLLAPNLLWLAENVPDTYLRIHKVIGLKDEMVHRLTGELQTDPSHLNYSMFFNVRESRLDPEILKFLGVDSYIFPPCGLPSHIAGHIREGVAKELDLPKGLPVVTGSSDGTAAMYGGGILQNGTAVLVSGSTDVLMTRSDTYPDDPEHILTVNTGPSPGTFLIGGPLGFSGATLSYLTQLFQQDAKKLNRAAASIGPAGPELLFSPGLEGEKAPFWMEHVRGGIVGLTLHHRPCHIYRAAMEGCAFRLKKLLMVMDQAGLRPRAINIVGGGATIEAWNQMRADITGIEIRKLNIAEATCMGTAMFCSQALSPQASMEELASEWIRIENRYFPDEAKASYYREAVSLFEEYIRNAGALAEQIERLKTQTAAPLQVHTRVNEIK